MFWLIVGSTLTKCQTRLSSPIVAAPTFSQPAPSPPAASAAAASASVLYVMI
jgi:hypothetical protein